MDLVAHVHNYEITWALEVTKPKSNQKISDIECLEAIGNFL